MNRIDWEQNILNVLSNISSKEYQQKYWFNFDDKTVSSPDELYNMLFDDYLFEDYLEEYGEELTQLQLKLAYKLIDEMNMFQCDGFQPEHILNHPKWESIRFVAKELLSTFNK